MLKADGTILGTRRYHVTVWRQMLDDGDDRVSMPGLSQIQGRIELQPMEGLTLVGVELVLITPRLS